MVERGKYLRLAFEARQAIRIRGKELPQNLQRHVAGLYGCATAYALADQRLTSRERMIALSCVNSGAWSV